MTLTVVGQVTGLASGMIQRQLVEPGISYSEVLVDWWRRRAFELLADPGARKTVVARRPFYSHAASIHRALAELNL